MKLVWICVVSLACTVGCVIPGPACVPGNDTPAPWHRRYFVQPDPVSRQTLASVPPGTFILVRAFGQVDAIRFVDVMAAPDDHAELSGCASYEVYRLTSGTKTGNRHPTATGVVSAFQPLFGHTLPQIQRGRRAIRGVTGEAFYGYPSRVIVGPDSEVAVSAWTAVENVDPLAAKLRWFRHNQGGATTIQEATKFSPADLP